MTGACEIDGEVARNANRRDGGRREWRGASLSRSPSPSLHHNAQVQTQPQAPHTFTNTATSMPLHTSQLGIAEHSLEEGWQGRWRRPQRDGLQWRQGVPGCDDRARRAVARGERRRR